MAELQIAIGSTNASKVAAVAEVVHEYEHLKHAQVSGVSVTSGVSDQPKSLDETIRGAMNRARDAFRAVTYSIGIESGLMVVPHTKSGYMDVCACAVYDGRTFHLGLSSAWEFPDPKIMRLMLDENMDMSEAINRTGLTNNPSIGAAEGAVGILTKGRVDRKEYTKQALRMALIHIDQ